MHVCSRTGRSMLRCAVVLMVWAGVAGRACAQAVREDLCVANGIVSAAVVSGHTLYIGGYFTQVGPATGGGLPFDSATGAPVAGFPKVTGWVLASASDGAGGWYIGGMFTAVGGVPRHGLAHVLSDRSVAAWDPDPGDPYFFTTPSIGAIAVSGSTVYVGGHFEHVGGADRRSIAALDATTGLATAWHPDASPAGGVNVTTMAVSGPVVYVGGLFSGMGGQSRTNLAAVDALTGEATPWAPEPDQSLTKLLVIGTTVYVAGYFEAIGGHPRHHLAAVDALTGTATAWDPHPGGSPDAYIFAMTGDGSAVQVAGTFTTIGGAPRHNLAALDPATGLAMAWDPAPDGSVTALARDGSMLYLAGFFTHVGGEERRALAAVDVATGLAGGWNPNSGGLPDANSWIYTLTADAQSVFVGGSFVTLGAQERHHIAAIDITTGQVTPWNPDAGVDDPGVTALASRDGRVYAAGFFHRIGGQARSFLAALDSVTGAATAWDPNPDRLIRSLAAGGTAVYACGGFEHIGGEARDGIAALDLVSGHATVWNPVPTGGHGFGGFDLALGEGVAYVCGDFTSIGGQPRNGMAAIDAATGLATAWNPAPDFPPAALTLSGSTLFVSGLFEVIGGQSRHHLAALDIATAGATSFDAAVEVPPSALEVQGGTLYVGGDFTHIDGVTRRAVAALDATSGSLRSWAPVLGSTLPSDVPSVRALASTPSHVYVCGSFTSVDGVPRAYVAGIETVVPDLPAELTMPASLNLRALGRWVTAYVEAPAGFDASAIDVSSIRLHGSDPGAPPVTVDPLAPVALGDQDGDEVPDLMIKFERAAVDAALTEGPATPVTVTGLVAGSPFVGATTVKVLRAHFTAPTAADVLAPGARTILRWDTPPDAHVASVALLTSTDEGATWALQAAGIPNLGRYEWLVPSLSASRVRLALVLVESSDPTGMVVTGTMAVSAPIPVAAPAGVGDGPASVLALERVGPNPGRGPLRVRLSLPDEAPGWLEVVDPAGRRVVTREIGGLGAGAHEVAFGPGLPPGLYFVRLIQGADIRTRRAVVLE